MKNGESVVIPLESVVKSSKSVVNTPESVVIPPESVVISQKSVVTTIARHFLVGSAKTEVRLLFIHILDRQSNSFSFCRIGDKMIQVGKGDAGKFLSLCN